MPRVRRTRTGSKHRSIPDRDRRQLFKKSSTHGSRGSSGNSTDAKSPRPSSRLGNAQQPHSSFPLLHAPRPCAPDLCLMTETLRLTAKGLGRAREKTPQRVGFGGYTNEASRACHLTLRLRTSLKLRTVILHVCQAVLPSVEDRKVPWPHCVVLPRLKDVQAAYKMPLYIALGGARCTDFCSLIPCIPTPRVQSLCDLSRDPA